MSDPLFQTFGDDSELKKIYDNQDLSGYEGAVFKSEAHGFGFNRTPGTSNQQTYIDIEPNKSVRPSFNRSDYDSFRPGEAVPQRQKRIMSACMASFDKVGIIRNVIDLMSDFASQGLVLVHPNKSIEKFYRKWFKHVKGYDRSERFLNYLYRCGNVAVQRSTAKINKAQEEALRRAAGADLVIQKSKTDKRTIPWSYSFLNPVAIDIEEGSEAIGSPKFYLNISKYTQTSLVNSQNNSSVFKTLPSNIQKRVKDGERKLPLDDDSTFFYHYKKDDWLVWANPMIYAILDDIKMLEKMKLADLAALDGTISQVRLWTLGDFDNKIVPTKAGLDKVKNLLASNVGGGAMDFVWGPELTFKESNSQAYKFLGSEKYQPVLTSIYAGLGIPPTLTGASGSGGGYTNNYVSLKTLVERLEYGREVLSGFWLQEIEYVRRAMGFRQPAEIHFDSIVLSDESAQKKLLLDLADRGILSDETLLERFREIPNIENVRVKREEKKRRSDKNMPQKASPFYNPQHKQDMAKLTLTKDMLDGEEYMEELDLPYQKPEQVTPDVGVVNPKKDDAPTGKPDGRPPFSKDSVPRKQKRVLPRTGEGTAVTLWGIEAQERISKILTPAICSHFNKKDARSLSKTEVDELEYLKLCIFTGMRPLIPVEEKDILNLLGIATKPSKDFIKSSNEKLQHLQNGKVTASAMRHIYAATYADLFIQTISISE